MMVKSKKYRKGITVLKRTAALLTACSFAAVSQFTACAASPWLFWDDSSEDTEGMQPSAEVRTVYKGQEGEYLTMENVQGDITFYVDRPEIVDIAEDGEIIPLKVGNAVVTAAAILIDSTDGGEALEDGEEEEEYEDFERLSEEEEDEEYTVYTYYISVCKKKAYKAVKKAQKALGSGYSQAKRMKKGYYDCSSLVWRSYSPYGITFGDDKWAPTAADQGLWCDENGKTLKMDALSVEQLSLLPGDVLYYAKDSDNGRYKKIYHTAIFEGYEVGINAFTGENTLGASILEANGTSVVRNAYVTTFSSPEKKVVFAARPTK